MLFGKWVSIKMKADSLSILYARNGRLEGTAGLRLKRSMSLYGATKRPNLFHILRINFNFFVNP